MKGPIDDIRKENYFEVPDGYFEDLPMRIQAKMSKTGSSREHVFNWKPVLRYAIPVLFVGFLSYLFFKPATESIDVEDYLTDITYTEAVEYLYETDLTLSEILPIVENDEDLSNLIQPPTLEEEYYLTEDLLYSPDWILDMEIEATEDI